jgi:hypothetical protein
MQAIHEVMELLRANPSLHQLAWRLRETAQSPGRTSKLKLKLTSAREKRGQQS